MVITHIVWEPLNCGSYIFREKVYVRLNENGHKMFYKIVYQRI